MPIKKVKKHTPAEKLALKLLKKKIGKCGQRRAERRKHLQPAPQTPIDPVDAMIDTLEDAPETILAIQSAPDGPFTDVAPKNEMEG